MYSTPVTTAPLCALENKAPENRRWLKAVPSPATDHRSRGVGPTLAGSNASVAALFHDSMPSTAFRKWSLRKKHYTYASKGHTLPCSRSLSMYIFQLLTHNDGLLYHNSSQQDSRRNSSKYYNSKSTHINSQRNTLN